MSRFARLIAAAPLVVVAVLARSDQALAPPAPTPAGSATLSVPGLVRPVRIVTDRWGIPHVRAETLYDLYFAWGFVTARDRLWQLELTRRAAGGSLSEWFGNRSLSADGGAQLFRLLERAESIWEREQAIPEVREPLERYAAGINAWIEECRSGRAPWPVEFLRLKKRPPDWRPEYAYLVLLAQAMLLDLDLPELDEADQIRAHGMAWVVARQRFERDVTYPSIPDSVAERLYGRPPRPTLPGTPFPESRSGARKAPGASRSRARAEGHRLDRHDTPATLTPAADASRAETSASLIAGARRTLAGWVSPVARDPDQRASNVFAVGPSRSASGAPMLANDPHLSLGDPSPLHAVHLSAPGVPDVAGVSVPGMPIIVSGRNPRCAWGLTALNADVMDVYADTLSRDGKSVRWQGGWAPITEAPFAMRYRVLGVLPIPPPGRSRRYTPHGPVVSYERKRGVALSLRWAGDDEKVTFAKLLSLQRAGTAAEVAAAVRTLVTPTHNVVAADRAGHVIYQVAGAIPRRGIEWPPGVLPTNGRYEWRGLIHPDSLPRWELGPDDLVVNGNNLPVGTPYPEPLIRYHFMQDRAARMSERLAGDESMTLADMCSVQNDVYSRGAKRFLPRLLGCAESLAAGRPARERAALDTLRGWDYLARRDRVAPTLFRAWLGAFQRRSRLEGLPMLAAAALDGRAPEALRAPGGEALERPAVAATEALALALRELEGHLGSDMARWQWGHAHRARLRHALAWRDSALQVSPVPMDGDNSTVAVGRSSLPWSTLVTHGPVWRHVVDLAVAESSLCVLPPGNAGGGPHARDHLDRWANHGYVPLLMDWRRIDAAAEGDLRLAPGPARTEERR